MAGIGMVTIGVDTHKHTHVAVAIDGIGERLGDLTIPTDHGGYEQLLAWARSFGQVNRFGIEGTGSYGAGLVSYLRRHDQKVIEAGRPDRRDRRQRGKSDTLDAENAARAALARNATAVPRRAEGTSEMLRQIKVARDIAVKARTSAMITLKALIVTAPDELRQELQPLSKAKLREQCAGLRPGPVTTPLAATKHSLRALARRWQALDAEIADHDEIVNDLTQQAAPQLREAFGIRPDIAAEMLILAGDQPRERLKSEAAFAMLCGAAPIPASSGMKQRHRLNYGGHRQANSALYRAVIVRMRFHPATIAYVKRRTEEGKTNREIIRCLKRYLAREIYRHLTGLTASSRRAHNGTSDPAANAARQRRDHVRQPRLRDHPKSVVDKHRSVNALAETVNGYYKAELIRGPARQGPWKTVEEVELATLGWVHWHNTQRLHGYLGDLPPVEFEQHHTAQAALEDPNRQDLPVGSVATKAADRLPERQPPATPPPAAPDRQLKPSAVAAVLATGASPPPRAEQAR